MRRQHRGGRAAGDDRAVHGAGDAPAASRSAPYGRGRRRRRCSSTVVDGDTHRRVNGARVVIGKRADYANTRGVASCRSSARTALPVRVSKPGYGAKVVRMPFKRQRQRHRAPLPDGAPVDDVRRQQPPDAGAAGHQGAAAVQGRLVARGRLARRVPGGRRGRRRVRRQLQGPRLRAEHAQRRGDLAAPAEPREDGVVARDRRRRPGRARNGRDRARARPAQRRSCAGTSASARRSSRRRSSPAGSTSSAPGTAASTRST